VRAAEAVPFVLKVAAVAEKLQVTEGGSELQPRATSSAKPSSDFRAMLTFA
jgi:hypothetical protein